MKKYNIIFVVLVYRNTQDLQDFFENLNVLDSHVVVVNSFFDNDSEEKFKKIADYYHADFLSVENKGYGYGNNRGCEYALANFDFNFLVISNADIIIEKLDVNSLKQYDDSIIAPSIINLSGKQQNPLTPWNIDLLDKWMYFSFVHNFKFIILFICALNRIIRSIFHLLNSLFNYNRVFSAHGSFVIFSVKAVKTLFPFYDEDVFLFTEEGHLAKKAELNNIKTFFVPGVLIRHKEDGSISLLENKPLELTKDSFITFYNKWHAHEKI